MLSISCLNVFMVEPLGSFGYRIILSTDGHTSTFSFPICVPYIYFSYLVTLARISRAMLNKSGDYEPMNAIVLFLVLVEMLRVFLLIQIWLRFVIHNFAMLRYTLFIPSAFNRKGWWILSKGFSASVEMTMWFLSLRTFMHFIMVIDLNILDHPHSSGVKPTWSQWTIFLMCFHLADKYFVGNVCIIKENGL